MTAGRRQYGTMRFQRLRRRRFFEGWYYKQVSPDEKTVLCLIPGVSVSGGKTSPFIQAILAEKTGGDWSQTSDWLNAEDFVARDEPFALRIGECGFRRDGVALAFAGDKIQVSGELKFHRCVAPPSSRWAPTVMGPFGYLPGMECVHSVISLTHEMEGTLQINGRKANFTGGKGYIEKDWGSSFPRRYVWLQSNHFAGNASLFFSWADIPFLGMRFHGYIAHLFYRGRHYRYATYTRGSCRLQTGGREAEIVLTNRETELRISASQAAGAQLLAPHRGQMVHTIKEGLYGRLSFCLQTRGEGEVHCDQTETAGVEMVMQKGSLPG